MGMLQIRQWTAEIIDVLHYGDMYARIDFTGPWDRDPVPGQFVMVGGAPDSLLKRPFGIAGFSHGIVSIVFKKVGKNTFYLAERSPGEMLSVIGPLGNGFPDVEMASFPLYVGGGCGLPPLLFSARARADMHAEKGTLFAGFRSSEEVYLVEEFSKAGVDTLIATENGSEGEKGMVTDILENYLDSDGEADIMYASGPMMMLKQVSRIAMKYSVPCFLCLEEYMACGFGACCGCAVPVESRDGDVVYVNVCTDGPVFKAGDIIWE